MAKHKAEYKPFGELLQIYLRLKNRWLFFTKPTLKKGIRNVLDRIRRIK